MSIIRGAWLDDLCSDNVLTRCSALAAVLESEERLEILWHLMHNGPNYVQAMIDLRISGPKSINYHLKVLLQAGLIIHESLRGQRRYYNITNIGWSLMNKLQEMDKLAQMARVYE